MLKEAIYYLVAVFAIITLFYFMVPMWNTFVNAWDSVTSGIPQDSTISGVAPTLQQNITVLIQYSFVAILLGLAVYLGLVAFRQEPTSWES